MSIFTKDCPQCAETNAAYAVRCKCGFAFTTDVTDTETQTEEETTLEEENLYQEYLAARARQADNAAKPAAAQPADQTKLKEVEPAKAPATTPVVTQKPNLAVVPPTPKAPVPPPSAKTNTPNNQTKPSAEAEQSWLITETEPDTPPAAPTQPPMTKPATPPPAKPATTMKPAPTDAKADVAKMSAAERAKKLEQRLKAVQTRRDNKPAATVAGTTSKTDTISPAAEPTSDVASVPATASQPTLTATATATATNPAKALATPTAGKTESPTPPSKPTNAAKPDQPQAVEEVPAPEPKKVNGNDTVPQASDPIEVAAADREASIPSTNATAKADLEAALQALNTTASETDATTPASIEDSNGGHQVQKEAQALLEEAQELLDCNDPAPLGDVTQDNGLGCTEKECPNCTALVPIDAEACGCGFAFPPDNDAMPSLSLSDSDVEALEKRKKSSGISHLG